MKNKLLVLASVFSLIVPHSEQVLAQSMDHSGLRSIFGEPVTSSANGSPQKESEVPLNMEIITQDDIKKMGARSIPEILRFIPGLSVQQYTFSQTEVSIRGYNTPDAERILVLVDGRQVYKDYFGQVSWDNIAVEIPDIVQIEVIKGPNTALFGFNAVSGVINIITNNPLYTDIGDVTVRYGTQDLREVSLTKSVRLFDNKVAFKLSAGGYESTHFDDVETFFADYGVTDNEDNERRSIDFDAWAQITESVQLHLEATKNNHTRHEFIVAKSPAHSKQKASSVKGKIIADTAIGIIEAEVYHNEEQADYELFTSSGEASINIDNRVTVAKLNDTFKIGNDHTFRLGLEFRDSAYVLEPADFFNDLEANIYSASGLWDWKVNDKLNTSVAIRFDRFEIEREGDPPFFNPFFTKEDYDQTREEFSYNIGAVYKATDKDTFRFTASRGADLPSFIEMGLPFFLAGPDGLVLPGGGPFNAFNVDNSTILGNPFTDTSIVHNFEIGFNRVLESINGMLKTAVFYQYNDEMQAFGAAFDYDALGFGSPASFLTNIGDSEAYGIELGLEGRYCENWDWFVNYSYVEIDDDLRNFGQNPDNLNAYNSPAEFEDSVINHTLNAHLGYKYDDWYFAIFGQYLSESDGLSITDVTNIYDQNEINDQIIVNGSISYQIKDNVLWSVSGTSILGTTQQVQEVDTELQLWTSLSVNF